MLETIGHSLLLLQLDIKDWAYQRQGGIGEIIVAGLANWPIGEAFDVTHANRNDFET